MYNINLRYVVCVTAVLCKNCSRDYCDIGT